MSVDYQERIKNYYNHFTKSERKVADFILSQSEKVISGTMKDIKRYTHVGDATIIRFAQKIGYSGFADFKIDIAKSFFSKKNNDSTNDSFSYINTVRDNLIDAIEKTRSNVHVDQLEKAIELIHEAKYIFVFGVGSSGISAQDTASRLLRCGIKATAIIDPHYQAQNASLMNEDCTVIAFSLSGKTRDIYESLLVAKKYHAKIIVITTYPVSPVANLANVVLQTAIEEYLIGGGSFTGRVSQLYIADILVTGYDATYDIDPIAMKEKVLRSIINKSID
jgi:DNA-binding MurR/RpiR family transcriptional regulator